MCVLQVVFDNGVTASQARSLVMTSAGCSYFLSITCENINTGEVSWTTFYSGRRSFLFLDGSFCTNGGRKQHVSIIFTHLSSLTFLYGDMNCEATQVTCKARHICMLIKLFDRELRTNASSTKATLRFP